MEEEGRAQEKGKGSGWREGDRGGGRGKRWETVIDTGGGGGERGEIPPSRHFPPFLWPQHCIIMQCLVQ